MPLQVRDETIGRCRWRDSGLACCVSNNPEGPALIAEPLKILLARYNLRNGTCQTRFEGSRLCYNVRFGLDLPRGHPSSEGHGLVMTHPPAVDPEIDLDEYAPDGGDDERRRK